MKAADGGRVHHVRRPLGGQHARHQGLDAMDHALDVDPNDPIPVGRTDLLQGHAVQGDAGVVACDGDIAEGPLHGTHRVFDRLTFRHVHADREGFAAGELDLTDGFGRIAVTDVADTHVHTPPRQRQRDASAYA